MIKIDSNINKILPWRIDTLNSKTELIGDNYEFSIRFVFEYLFLKKLNNIKIEILTKLKTNSDTRTANKIKTDNKILQKLQVRSISKTNENNENIILTKIIDINSLKRFNFILNQKHKNKISADTISHNFDKNTYKNFYGLQDGISERYSRKEETYIYDLKFQLPQEIISKNSDVYFRLGESNKDKYVTSKFSNNVLVFNTFQSISENNFVFSKPIVKHFIDKQSKQVKFEITNRDKNAKILNVYQKNIDKFGDEETKFYLVNSEIIGFNKNLFIKFPHDNQESIFRFVLLNNLGIESEYEEIILSNNNDLNNFIFYTKLLEDSIELNISGIHQDIVSFLTIRKQVFPRGNQEYKFIISKNQTSNSLVFSDTLDLLDGFIYRYELYPINKSGKKYDFHKFQLQEYEKLNGKSLTTTKISEKNNEFFEEENKKFLRTNFDVNINSRNLKNIATDLQFNNINNVNSSGGIITGSVGLFSKNDIFDNRVKNILLDEEFTNHFGYEISLLNKKNGKIIDLGKNFGNNFDKEIDLENIGKSGVFEYVIKTKSRHKSVFDNEKYKFFHPFVKRFGTLVTKEANNLKVVKDDFLIGDLHEIKFMQSIENQESESLIDLNVKVVENYFVFNWKLSKPNISFETFELILDDKVVAKIFAIEDRLSFYFVKKMSDLDFGKYQFYLKAYDKNKTLVSTSNFNTIVV